MTELRESQKLKRKKTGKRRYKAFIRKVSWWHDHINFEFDNSYIYERLETVTYKNGKTAQVVTLPKLPRWNDVTRIQEVAYFAKFLAETKVFSNLKPFTLDFTYTRHDKYKSELLSTIRDDFSKKVYNNLRYYLGDDDVEMVYIIEGKNKRINLHGVIDVSRIKDLKNTLKQSASTYRKEYNDPSYRNMLQIKDNYNEHKGGSYGWLGYMNKRVHSENGLYLSHSLMQRVREDYEQLYRQYENIIKRLKAEGIRVTHTKDNTEENDDTSSSESNTSWLLWRPVAVEGMIRGTEETPKLEDEFFGSE